MSRAFKFPADHKMQASMIVCGIRTLLDIKPSDKERAQQRQVWSAEGFGDATEFYPDDNEERGFYARVVDLWQGGALVELTWGDLDPITPAVKAWLDGEHA